eukprot:3361938-Rhodomonas_salina.1
MKTGTTMRLRGQPARVSRSRAHGGARVWLTVPCGSPHAPLTPAHARTPQSQPPDQSPGICLVLPFFFPRASALDPFLSLSLFSLSLSLSTLLYSPLLSSTRSSLHALVLTLTLALLPTVPSPPSLLSALPHDGGDAIEEERGHVRTRAQHLPQLLLGPDLGHAHVLEDRHVIVQLEGAVAVEQRLLLVRRQLQ